MAFDQNSIPKDLRPVNVARINTEDARIAPVTTSGRYPDGVYSNPPPPRGDISSPPSLPVYYSAVTTSDTGFVGLGFGNQTLNPVHPPAAVPVWAPRMPAPMPTVGLSQQSSAASISPASYPCGPQFSTRVSGGNTADQTTDGGDDSVSGKKVKFLCSFGGKIIPRPSDGKLRYVGGQTRIIGVRKDVNFEELVQKMVDTYGQPVIIKYQLPEEDLDALVSVSCPDDLDNMMDEYEKLVERSSDGSAKLRVFLFSAAELDSSGMVHFGDLHESGQRYVDAVNGIMEGVGGGLTRKESIASATSTQNSDASGIEPIDTALVNQDVSGPPPISAISPKSDIVAASNDIAAKLVCVDANPIVATDAPAVAPLVVPVASGPSQATPLQPEMELKQTTSQPLKQQVAYDFQQAGVKFPPPPSPYLQGYVDPHQMDYSKVPPQMVYTNPQVVAPPRPILIQPPYHDNAPNVVPQQFIPGVHMTVAPTSSHLSINPNMMQPLMQHQRVVAYPADKNYNGYQGRVPIPGVTVGYNWHQVPSNQEHVALPEGYVPQQQVPKMGDCYMCQKALPHAHSDPVPPNPSNTSPTTASDMNPVSHSLCLGEVSRINTQSNVVASLPSGAPPINVDGDNADPFGIVTAQSNEHVKAPIAQARKDDTVNLQQQVLPNPVLDVSYQQNIQPMELHEGTQAPGIQHGDGNAACFAVDPVYRQSSVVSPNRNGDNQDSANSLFSNQDPWNTRYDHFPPPRPSKIATRKEASSPRDAYTENRLGGETSAQFVDVVDMQSPNLVRDHSSELSTKGSAEDLIKQELQATAEGVATSVLQSSVPSNPDSSSHEQELQNDSDAVLQAKREGINIKQEKTNLGFPLSDSIGRLQIIKNSDLEVLQELGSGTFGTVYHGKWKGTDVAIKRINDRCFAGKPSERDRMKNDFWNEAIKLADLHHPNVVAFYGVVLDGPGGSVATVTEYMVNGSLRTALQKNERTFDKRKRLLITMDVAFGMEYLHSRNIVHFDLKSDNLLVNLRDPHRPICKVGDLGLSKVKCQTLISGGVRGTLPWMAPELLNGSSSLVSEKVDVFSFGIVMWELLTGEEPYSDLYYGAIIGGIVSNTLRPPVPENCDPDWKSLMERCWSAEPSERPNFPEISNELRTMAAKIPPKGQNPAGGGAAANTRNNA